MKDMAFNWQERSSSSRRPRKMFSCPAYSVPLALMGTLSVIATLLTSASVHTTGIMPIMSGRRLQLLKTTTVVLESESRRPRIALCFFGLTRSLKITLPSIKKNIIAPIRNSGYDVDILLHTYSDVSHLKNPRTGEDTDLNTDEWKLLNPTDVVLTNQTKFLKSVRSRKEECLRVGTGWPKEKMERQRTNVDNLLAQLNSIYEVGRLMEKHHASKRYSAVLFARPDVHFSCPFPVDYLSNIKPNVVYTPDWAQYSGINDRFALMSPSAARLWKRRKFFTLHECLESPIHAERFASVFLDALGLENRPLTRFGFVRVRSTGEFSDLDKEFAQLCR